MSEIKALGKLRAAGRNMAKGRNLENHEECNLLLLIADEIEREIAERYMELPLDANGESIHIGDLIEYHGRDGVYRLHAQGVYVYSDGRLCGEKCVMNERLGIWEPDKCSHYKPRTLEDVLREYALEMNLTYETGEIGGEERAEALDDLTAKYAAEIRELMEADE